MIKNSKYNYFITIMAVGDGRKDDKMEKEIFVKCQCCCFALETSRDEEDCFNVALWSHGPWGA